MCCQPARLQSRRAAPPPARRAQLCEVASIVRPPVASPRLFPRGARIPRERGPMLCESRLNSFPQPNKGLKHQNNKHALTRDQTLGQLPWELGVLATGPPGKSR